MLLIPCPFCGARAEIEFACGGEACATQPASTADDAAWTAYLFLRRNTLGLARERWFHAAGCRQWFFVFRNTLTHEVAASWRIGETTPEIVQ